MKRIFMLLTISIAIFSLAACSEKETDDVKHADQTEEPAKIEIKDEKVADANAEAVKDITLTPPTERTEPIEGGKMPWDVYEFYGSDEAIQERVMNEEVVFLLSDANKLEDNIEDFAKGNSDKPAEWWHSILTYFNIQVSEQHPELTDYFAKMKEVETALFDKKIETIPNLINEAREIRGAN